RCVYLDKDLVLPFTGNSGTSETFFVAASTDLERAEVMMKRVREQLSAVSGFEGVGVLQVSSTAVQLPSTRQRKRLEELVQSVAEQITATAMAALARNHLPEV